MTYNLGVLLSSDRIHEQSNGEIFLPTEDDVLAVLECGSFPEENAPSSSDSSEIIAHGNLAVNELCAVVWEFKGQLNWYLGFVLAMCDSLVFVTNVEDVIEEVVLRNILLFNFVLHMLVGSEVEMIQILVLLLKDLFNYF